MNTYLTAAEVAEIARKAGVSLKGPKSPRVASVRTQRDQVAASIARAERIPMRRAAGSFASNTR